MNTTLKLSLVAAIAVAGVYAWYVTRSASGDDTSHFAPATGVADTTMPERLPDQPRAIPAVDEHREPTPEDIEARGAQARRDREAAFMAESVSPEWAARTEQQILDALSPRALAAAGASTPLAEVSADCRNFSCRIEATYADQDEFEVVQQAMMGGIATQLPVSTTFVDRRPDGTIRGTIYATANAQGPKRRTD